MVTIVLLWVTIVLLGVNLPNSLFPHVLRINNNVYICSHRTSTIYMNKVPDIFLIPLISLKMFNLLI